MNCRDLSEIVDSYLSNELLVETNHEVIRHLENCRDCREMLSARREMRARLKRAIVEARESHIDTAFATKLRESLRSSVERPRPIWTGFRFAFAAAAVVLVTVFGVISVLRWNGGSEIETAANMPERSSPTQEVPRAVPASLIETSADAFDDHKNCALAHKLKERPITLEKAASTVDKVNLDFDKSVIDALKERFGGDVELIRAHYCLINGRHFTHVILSFRKRTMSVLMTKLDDATESKASVCGNDAGLGAACFSSGGYGIYVVSDSGDPDNLLAAGALFSSVVGHIARAKA